MAQALKRGIALVLAIFTIGGSLLVAEPAAAQFSDSYKFIQAVKKRDLAEAQKLASKPGNTLVNIRDRDSGDTALHIVVRGKDVGWVAWLLQRHANANISDRDGNTPLMVAAGNGFTEGANLLLQYGKARVDEPNARGETALIRAVQRRDAAMARLLLDAGADPDRADNLTGMSARDYAERDTRGGPVRDLLRDAKPKGKGQMMGPAL